MEALFILKTYRVFNSSLRFYRHKMVNDNDFDYLVNHLNGVMREAKNEAHILSLTDNCCAYKINNNIYFIPAKPKGVLTQDNKMIFYLDYPCEMIEADLTEIN